MDIRAKQYELAHERDEKINGMCVLCAVGFPRGTRRGTEHHEIISKAKIRGKHNLDKLYALPNIAMTCQYHHHHFQYLPIVWYKAMVQLDLAQVEDYQDHPDWEEKYPPFDCMGEFGYGDVYYRMGVPTTMTMALIGTGNKTTEFCGLVCPFAEKCMVESRDAFRTS